jgi:hypothetical protein
MEPITAIATSVGSSLLANLFKGGASPSVDPNLLAQQHAAAQHLVDAENQRRWIVAGGMIGGALIVSVLLRR